MNRHGIFTALATILILVPGSAHAQRRPRDPLRGQTRVRLEMEQRLRTAWQRRLFSDLGLTRAERSDVQQTIRTFGERRVDFARQEREARLRVQDLQRRRAGGEEIPEAEARGVLDTITQLRDEEARLFRDEQEALLETLRPDQVLLLLQAREALGEQIRRRRRGGGPGGGMMPGDGRTPGRFQPGPDGSPG